MCIDTPGGMHAGATAVCFQCTWPSRFGDDSILAAKVLNVSAKATGRLLAGQLTAGKPFAAADNLTSSHLLASR